jgi:hypothetical protein
VTVPSETSNMLFSNYPQEMGAVYCEGSRLDRINHSDSCGR